MDNHVEGPYVIEHGDVWYRERKPSPMSNGLRHVCDGTQEIAIAHDGEVLLKVGSAASVDDWYSKNAAKLVAMSEAMGRMGEDGFEVVIVRLPVSPETVAEMNACIAYSGRVAKLADNLASIGAADPSLYSRPSYPR
ncbi:hypothetical protein G6L37_02870 [Agrobacterium rubi]|nr:hypothetical protein [Agrobacterium rubi]NTF24320.1 hypothetical protein [Agrobacterium rubi]